MPVPIAKFLSWHSWPGFYIAILALLGVLVPLLRDKLGKTEKAIWTAVMFALVLLEIRSLKLASDDFEKDQKDENDRFAQIAAGLQTKITNSQIQFSATMSKLGDTINTETGGGTFCYLSLSPAQTGWMMYVTKVGRYTLRAVDMLLIDSNIFYSEMEKAFPDVRANRLSQLDAMQQATTRSQTQYPVGDFARDGKLLGLYPYPSSEEQDLSLSFGAFNGIWLERLAARKVNGKWLEAISVEGKAGGRVIEWKKIDPGFPLERGHVRGWPVHQPKAKP